MKQLQHYVQFPMAIAGRQALDFSSTLRAVGVCLIGWLANVFFAIPIAYLLGWRPRLQLLVQVEKGWHGLL